jgi:RNA polymerase sigma-70 factor, ECF subfamily
MASESPTTETMLEHERDAASDEHTLILDAQRGDTSAFETLYRLHVGRIYALCLRLARDTTRAERFTQDTFVRAWEMLESFRGESMFSTWLHRVAVNIALTDFRSQRRRDARLLVADDVVAFDQPAKHADLLIAIDLEEAITMLPPQAKIIFTLHDIEGYKHEEIAEQLGLAVGTCKAQLHRARKLLKEALAS